MDRGDGPAAVPSCFFAYEDPRSTRAFDAVFFFDQSFTTRMPGILAV